MKLQWHRFVVLLGVLSVLAACVPVTTIQPQELLVNHSFAEAFAIVSTTINTQPYPSNKGGWVVVNSDQVGGIILAEMNYTIYNWWTGAQTAIVERVSVAFNTRGEGQTALNVSGSSGDEARSLMAAIVRAVTN